MTRLRRSLIVTCCLCALLAGCASAPPPPVLTLCTIEASPGINPSVTRRASPVLLRVFALKSAAAFNSASFLALYQKDQSELGADLLTKDEYTVAPGESQKCGKLFPADTRFIGVIAAFRDIEHAEWRATAPIDVTKKATATIRIAELSVAVSIAR